MTLRQALLLSIAGYLGVVAMTYATGHYDIAFGATVLAMTSLIATLILEN